MHHDNGKVVDSRISKVLSLRTDSAAMLEALDAISEFYTSNTIESRRSLRQDLEYRNITLAKKFICEYDVILGKVIDLEESSIRFDSSCNELSTRVTDADNNMKAFMSKASELETQRNDCLKQSNEIALFLNRFQLSTQEIDALYRSSLDTYATATIFFNSLQRLQSAYNGCKIMVEHYSYSAGFELLDILRQHQDMACQRLFDWFRSKCESMVENSTNNNTNSIDEIDITTQTAVKFLKMLPVYISQVQDLIINSRRSQLVQRFVIALTQGGSGRSRAIDLHSHDASRYISDMLAWMHQSIASEEELLVALFDSNINSDSINTDNNNTPTITNSGGDVVSLSVNELLARCLQGLGRPLRVRVQQTLESRISVGVLYSLIDLLTFYEVKFDRMVKIENAVHSTIKGCLTECKRLFQHTLNKQSETLLSAPPSYPLDLTASLACKECSKQLQEILKVNENALSASQVSKTKETVDEFDSNALSAAAVVEIEVDSCSIDVVLGSIIQPLLQATRLSGQSLQQVDMAVYMLNNVSILKADIAVYLTSNSNNNKEVCQKWCNLLETESVAWLGVLVNEEVQRTLKRSDLDKILDLIDVLPRDFVASEQPGLSSDRISTVMRAFYASLFSTLTPQFDRLADVLLRESARKAVAIEVARSHEKIHALISTDKHLYNKSVLIHTVSEINGLLGC